jgi:hypothetical protein
MNATLESSYADRHLSASCDRSIYSRAGWNESDSSKIKAFGRRHRITGDAVKLIDKSASESGNRRKRMYLTAAILYECWASNIEMHLARLVAPLVCVLSRCQFSDEFIKRRMPITNACTVTQDGIESSGVTVV